MQDYFKNLYDPETFRQEGYKIVDLLADYFKQNLEQKGKVLNYIEPDDMFDSWVEFFNDQSKSTNDFFIKVLEDSVHLHHPRNMGHQVTPALPLSGLTEFFATSVNNGMAIYEMGPAATAIEKFVINWICSKIGYDENSEGIITSGGSLGNLTALYSAKQAYFRKHPGTDINNCCIISSSGAHYSVARTGRILGLKDENIYKVNPSADYKLSIDQIRETKNDLDKQGKHLLCVSVNACSTALGIYDHLEEIADYCCKENIWLHVDAAHGGGALMSEKYRHLLKGIEKADSVIIDFHKMFLVSSLTTAVVYKDKENSRNTFEQDASYLLDENYDWYNVAKRTLECTKKSMSYKVYLILKTYGEEMFSRFVESRNDLAVDFYNIIENSEDFEAAAAPESNIVCFRYINCDPARTDEINRKIRDIIVKSGEFYLVQTEINGKLYLRVSLMNPLTDIEIMNRLLNLIKTTASKL